MARQGKMLRKGLMFLSANTELLSSASNPNPNVHMLSPANSSCVSVMPIEFKLTSYVEACKIKVMLAEAGPPLCSRFSRSTRTQEICKASNNITIII